MLKPVKWHRFLCAALVAWFVSLLTLLAASQSPPDTPAGRIPSDVGTATEAPLMVWNRIIFVSRSSFQQFSPAQRAAGAKVRIEALPEMGPWNIEDRPLTLERLNGILISVNKQPVFVVLSSDLEPEAGQ